MRIRGIVTIAVVGWTAALLVAQPGAPAGGPATQPSASRPARGGFLGVGIQEITQERAKALKLHDTSGVEVTRVRPDSPAEAGGLTAGDVIVQYNGVKAESMAQISRLVRDTPPGRDVKIDIIRNGIPLSLNVRIGVNPGPFSRDGVPIPPDAPRVFQGWHSPLLGLEVEAVEGQLAQYFGVKQGVLVRSVMPHSPAERAAIHAGDVILRVDDAQVSTPFDISAKLRTIGTRTFPISILRDHKEMSFPVTLEAAPESGRH